VIGHSHRLIGTRSGRHGRHQELQRPVAGVAELKVHVDGNGETDTGTDLDDIFPVLVLPLDLTPPADEVPNLFDRPVADGLGDRIGREHTMIQPAALQIE
jgi:hypothetical protein